MRVVLIAAVLSTIMASSSSAQTPKPKVDTFEVKLIRGQKVATDSAARADSLAIRKAAADSGEIAVVERIVADTAWARVGDRRKLIDIPSINGSTAGTAIVANKKVRLERRAGKWTRVPAPRGGWASDSAAAAAPPPRRPQ